MTQDLFDWLNAAHNNNKDYAGTGGLLLAPMLDGQTDNRDTQEAVSLEPELPEIDAITPQDNVIEEKINALNDARQTEDTDTEAPNPYDDSYSYNDVNTEPEDIAEEEVYPEPEDTLLNYNDTQPDEDSSLEESNDAPDYVSLPDDSLEAPNYEDSSLGYDASHEEHVSLLNQAWHEAAGFQLNLDEPPPQMWTDIDDSDDEPRDYEENHSLQGDAYIPVVKHGANFTQRLQSTLKTRKDRAAKQHELDAENANPHPYVQKAIIFCGVLLMTLGFAYLGLWFVQRETPDSLNERAMTQYEKGNFDEAANLYGRGYKRYPHVLSFLTGLARSAEKAGRTQTAIAAWNEYMSSLPKDDAEHRQAAQRELDKLIPGGGTKTPEPSQVQTIALPQTKPAATRPSLPEVKIALRVKPATFDEFLAEANSAFNIGMFSRAINSFHRAHAIRPDDLRPYIGLIESYRAKGMFFEAKRLIDEARKKFGRVPALEMESYYLRRE